MKYVKNISFFVVLGVLITVVGIELDSRFLFHYLQQNIIGLLLTLLAINTATLGLIASKIQDIVVKYPKMNFSSTIKEMKVSLLEQIILILVSIVCLLLMNSPLIVFEHKDLMGDSILTIVLIYAISILWDTGKAVFIIIEKLQEMNS